MDDLPARLADGLDDAFPEVVRAHQDLVFGIALRLLADRAAAEDVAQEAFIRAYQALRRYAPDRLRGLRLRAWLGRITVNLALNQRRGRQASIAPLSAAGEQAHPSDGPLRLAERREEQRMWLRLLNGLPERYRLAVALRHVEGLAYPELAELLGRPLGSVKSDVHRGVRLLRAAYEAELRLAERKEAV